MASKGEGSSYVGAQAVLPFADCLKCLLEIDIALDEDDRALLKRWLDRDRAGKVWSAIRAQAEQHEGPIGVDARFISSFSSSKGRKQQNQRAKQTLILHHSGEDKEVED